MFKIVAIFFCAAGLLAGCSSMDGSRPDDWADENLKPEPALTTTNPPPASIQTNLPVIAPTNAPPAAATNFAKPAPAPVYTWMPLARWAAENKVGKPHKLSDLPLATYAIGSSNGVMIVPIGSRDLAWNGVEIETGFEPQMIDGEIYLHGLDLEKSLKPFMCGPPLKFSTNRVIVIDPGHGGANAGTLSVLDKRPEKEFTLDWAKRLKPLLETNGWTVFLTRTNDTDIALSNRVNFAEAQHADLFISLHFNSSAPNQKQSGLETYCLTPTGMPSNLTRGYDDVWSQNFPNNAFDRQNVQLAYLLHNALLRGSGEEDRGVRRARFIGVLRGQKRPAVLIEGGYLSNPREAAQIEDPAFRQKLAQAIADALK